LVSSAFLELVFFCFSIIGFLLHFYIALNSLNSLKLNKPSRRDRETERVRERKWEKEMKNGAGDGGRGGGELNKSLSKSFGYFQTPLQSSTLRIELESEHQLGCRLNLN
jgi:hypothetical protein